MFSKEGSIRLVFVNGPYSGKSVTLQPDRRIIIGRGRETDLPLDDETLSRRHCMVIFEEGHFYVDDLDSINGTFVNGSRITERTELQEFDRVFFGSTEMELRCD